MRRAIAEHLVLRGGLAQRLKAIAVRDEKMRHLEHRLAEIGEAAKSRRRAVMLGHIALDHLARDRALAGDARRDVAVLVKIVAFIKINEHLPRRIEPRIKKAVTKQNARGLAHHGLYAAGPTEAEAHHIASRKPMQHMRRVHELRAIALGG